MISKKNPTDINKEMNIDLKGKDKKSADERTHFVLFYVVFHVLLIVFLFNRLTTTYRI